MQIIRTAQKRVQSFTYCMTDAQPKNARKGVERGKGDFAHPKLSRERGKCDGRVMNYTASKSKRKGLGQRETELTGMATPNKMPSKSV